jgi:hypothetical protein
MDTPFPGSEIIHTIEFSEYERVCKELESVKADLAVAISVAGGQVFLDNLKKNRSDTPPQG